MMSSMLCMNVTADSEYRLLQGIESLNAHVLTSTLLHSGASCLNSISPFCNTEQKCLAPVKN